MAFSNEDVQKAKELRNITEQLVASQKELSQTASEISYENKQILKDAGLRLSAETKIKEEKRRLLKNIQDLKKTNKDMYKEAREFYNQNKKEIELSIKHNAILEEKREIIENMNKGAKRAAEQKKQDIEMLRQEGGLLNRMKANAMEYVESMKDARTGKFTNESLKGAAQDTVSMASNPKQMLGKMGAWGVLLEVIVDAIDGMRKMKGEMIEASAASGGFGDSIRKAGEEAGVLAQGQMEFMMDYGMTVQEVAGVYKALKATGIEALGAISPVAGQMTKTAEATMVFAKATGETVEVVAGRFADFIRNFGVAKNDIISTYNEIYSSASKAAKDGVMPAQQYMQTVQSLGATFADAGGNIKDVNDVLSGTIKVMQGMGRPLQNIQKVAQGILGITKAGEGWQVFMAKMSGTQGGYARSLFAAQQRQPNFNLAAKGEFDAQQMVKMAQSALLRPTAGISDAATRQLMIERMGSQYGMDTETTQVFQQLAKGAISQDEAAGSIEKLRKAAIEANMTQKGMFDILKNILVGLIAKPLAMIYRVLAGSDDSQMEMMDKISEIEGGGAAIGARVKKSGLAMVHAQERIVKKAELDRGGNQLGQASNNNFNFQVTVDENNIRNKFKEMENKTIAMMMKQQQSNFVG